MILLAATLGSLGLVCMMLRQTLLGFLIGAQILVLSGTLVFVLAGIAAGMPVDGFIFGLFVMLGGMGQLVVGYSLAIRLFLLKGRIELKDLREMKK